MKIYLNDLGLACALGADKKSVLTNFLSGEQSFMQADASFGVETIIGKVDSEKLSSGISDTTLSEINKYGEHQNTHNNQLALLAFEQIAEKLAEVKAKVSEAENRAINIAVVVGTSTSGIASGEQSMQDYLATGSHNPDYHYEMQEMGATADFIATLAGANASVYSISTACTSSAKALISGQRLLESGLADIVIAGGVDSLCKMTINGFNALESISPKHTQPFQAQRCGINIGEGAALFLMSKLPGEISLKGFGETSDAHHISAPDPEGKGAAAAMSSALARANLDAQDISYINLHGTGTVQNDAMEAKAVANIFDNKTPCSASKQLHGHCLGAAGAIEAGLCWLLLSKLNETGNYPKMHVTGDLDTSIDEINLITEAHNSNQALKHCMSNSYAFGGNNASLILSNE